MEDSENLLSIEELTKVFHIRHGLASTRFVAVDRVTLANGAFAELIGRMPPPGNDNPAFETSMVGTDTLVGYSGTLWRYGPQGEPPLELLMSPDPRLGRVGDVFRSVIDLIIGVTGSMLGPDQLRQVFAAGTPLKISSASADPEKKELLIELESVDMAAIDPARFTLPGPVIPAADFVKLVAPPMPTPVPTEAVKIEAK